MRRASADARRRRARVVPSPAPAESRGARYFFRAQVEPRPGRPVTHQCWRGNIIRGRVFVGFFPRIKSIVRTHIASLPRPPPSSAASDGCCPTASPRAARADASNPTSATSRPRWTRSRRRRTTCLARCGRCNSTSNARWNATGTFYLTLVPIRPRRRGERRFLRTFAGVSLRPPVAFNPRPRCLSTPPDAFELHHRYAKRSLSYLREQVMSDRTLSREAIVAATTAVMMERAPAPQGEPCVGGGGYGGALEARPIHWFSYDRVGVVNVDP